MSFVFGELMKVVIGIDGGGTKSRAVLATPKGVILGQKLGKGSNHQTVGEANTEQVLRELLDPLLKQANDFDVEIGHVCFGLSGMDRPKDEEIFRRIIRKLLPKEVPYSLVNDTFLILRAGAPEGWGIGVVSGTGSNCVMIDQKGNRDWLGGLGYEFGDEGCGTEIGIDALRAAMRGQDGRGPKTQLTARIKSIYKLQRLDDLLDRITTDAKDPIAFSDLAPIVFAAADAEDPSAKQILVHAGNELALSVTTLAKRHFAVEEKIPIVLGGSIFQHGSHSAMRNTFVSKIKASFPNAFLLLLNSSPVHGGILLAFDQIGELTSRAKAVLRARLSDH